MMSSSPRVSTRSRVLATMPPAILPMDPATTSYPTDYQSPNTPEKGFTTAKNDLVEVATTTAIPALAPLPPSASFAPPVDLQASPAMEEEDGAAKGSAEAAEAHRKKAQQEAEYRAKFNPLVNGGHFPYFLSSLLRGPLKHLGAKRGTELCQRVLETVYAPHLPHDQSPLAKKEKMEAYEAVATAFASGERDPREGKARSEKGHAVSYYGSGGSMQRHVEDQLLLVEIKFPGSGETFEDSLLVEIGKKPIVPVADRLHMEGFICALQALQDADREYHKAVGSTKAAKAAGKDIIQQTTEVVMNSRKRAKVKIKNEDRPDATGPSEQGRLVTGATRNIGQELRNKRKASNELGEESGGGESGDVLVLEEGDDEDGNQKEGEKNGKKKGKKGEGVRDLKSIISFCIDAMTKPQTTQTTVETEQSLALKIKLAELELAKVQAEREKMVAERELLQLRVEVGHKAVN
jgi:hypothetical protein